MENKKLIKSFSIALLIFLNLILTSSLLEDVYVNASSGSTSSSTTSSCTHTVYSTGSPDKYHYSYCRKCGKCKSRTRHSVDDIENTGSSSGHATYCSCGRYLGEESHSYESFRKYNDSQHYAKCDCGYEGLQSHNSSPAKLTKGETVKGKVYSTTEELDTYHKAVCSDCDTVLGVEGHTWTGGNTSAHKCSGCDYVHSKKNDATKGRHYFNLKTIHFLGSVAPCVVCKEKLVLTYTNDSILPKLPKKEQYTMVGNPNPMKEVILNDDQKIKANFMPINENGEIILLEETYLRVRSIYSW